MKKRKGWLYALLGVSLIIAVALIITLYPKAKDKSPDNYLKGDYVSLTLNTPQTIYLFKGNTAKIPSELIVVKPEDKKSELICEVVVLSDGTENGISFSNNILTANHVGEYALQFKVPKNKGDYVKKQQKVVVHEDASLCHVIQVDNQFITTDNPDISTLFSFSSSFDYQIETSPGLSFNQNKLNAIDSGTYSVKFIYTIAGIEYFYNFSLEVHDVPQFSISVIGINDDTYVMPLSQYSNVLGYLVSNSTDSSGVLQSITSSSDNHMVATVDVIGEGLLYIQAVGIGEANITLTYTKDSSITYTFKVVIT